jgi:hypothetical protein
MAPASIETAVREYKRECDPSRASDRLALVKEIVSFANAGGGDLWIGAADDGGRPGVPDSVLDALDPARLCDLVDGFIAPDHIELIHRAEVSDAEGRQVLVITVPPHHEPPLVFSKDDNYQENQRQMCEFRRGDVNVRKGTKAERARRGDYQAWVREAVEHERNLWKSRVALVTDLPSGAQLRIVTAEGEESDEPAPLLDRATRSWVRDSAKLLTGSELVALLLVADDLDFTVHSQLLVVHGALRRRPTLWHWESRFLFTPEATEALLLDAVGGRDRDKSDAGRAITEVAALVLEDGAYARVIAALSASSYRHFREAAERGADKAAVLERLRGERRAIFHGEDLTALSDGELRARSLDTAREMIPAGRHQAESLALGRLGLEMMARAPGSALL